MTTTRPWQRPAALLNLLGAGTFAAGLALTPWETQDSTYAYHEALAAHPGRAQAAALTLHFAYLLLAAGAFALIGVLERRRSWWLRIGTGLTVLGATTMPGLLITDAYDLAMAQELPREQSVAASEAVGELVLSGVLGGTAMLGFIVGPLLLWVAAWRAGFVAGPVPALVLASWLVGFATLEPAVLVAGAGILIAAMALAARTLWAAPRRVERSAASPAAAAVP